MADVRKDGLKRNDVTLKHLTLSRSSIFFPIVAQSAIKEPLATELHVHRTLYTDNVALLEDGSIWHIEFQSENDSEMPWRMYQYKALLLMHHRRIDGTFPRIWQRVYYTGNGALTMPTEFRQPGTGVKFEVVDLKGQFNNGQDLISSRSPLDRILGLLCMPLPKNSASGREYLRAWQRVANSLLRETPSGQTDARTLFEFAAQIRGVDVNTIRGWPKMPITADLNQTIIAKQIYEQGIEIGNERGYLRGLTDSVVDAFQENSGNLKPHQIEHLMDLDASELMMLGRLAHKGQTFTKAIEHVKAARTNNAGPGQTR